MKRVELLSPCGDMDSLKAAVYNGADAVYFAGENFGARKFAKNFTRDEIKEAVKFCHLYGVRAYITVNTIMFENEVDELTEYVRFLHKTGVDALIVQDLGIMNLVRNKFPNMEIHASTQSHNIDNYSASFMKNMGCKRLVFAREMILDEIKNINVDIEKEVFVHGALCYSYSGCCLFSAFNNARSGNRGECVGSCRMKYKLFQNNKEINTDGDYILSTKSLYTLDRIGELIDAGIDSFKIEGRMKSKEYVGYITRLYRNKIDEYLNNKKVSVSKEEVINLQKLYNREFTNGYLFNKYGRDFMNNKSPNHLGVVIGDVLEISKKYIKIKLSMDLNQEDGIRFDNNEGMIVNRLYNNKLLLVSHASSGDIVYLDNKMDIKNAKIIRKTIDKKLNDEINNFDKKKVNISISCDAHIGNKLKLTIKCDNDEITKEGIVVEEAKSAPMSKERIEEQLLKLGNTPFKCNKIDISMSDNIFVSIKELNELRREAVDEVINIRENSIPHEFKEVNFDLEKCSNFNKKTNINVLVRDEKQLNEIIKYDVNYIYTDDYDLYNKYKDKYNMVYKIPRALTNYRELTNEKILAGNTSIIQKYEDNNTLIGDTYLNVVNKYSVDYLKNKLELLREDKALGNCEFIIYGTPELMITKHDLIDDYVHSNDKDKEFYKYYIESLNKDRFRIIKKDKLTYIYHKDKINYLNKIDYIKSLNINSIRIEFFDEYINTIKRILDEVFNG
jgi:putative protease